MSQLSLNLTHRFLSNFSFCFPWAIRWYVFRIFMKKNNNTYSIFFFTIFFFRFRYHGTLCKTLLLLQITAESFQTSPEFSSQRSSQNCLFLKKFEISNEFFAFSLTWGPNGSKNFKMLLLIQIAAKGFQTFPEVPSQNSCGDFWNFVCNVCNAFGLVAFKIILGVIRCT